MEQTGRAAPDQPTVPSLGRFEFIGEQLSLDFANTLGGHRSGRTRELVMTYADLIAWGFQAGLVAADRAHQLLRAAERDPAGATAVLQRAWALREAIYALVKAQMGGQPPHQADLAVLNGELAAALLHRRVTASAGGLVWSWEEEQTASSFDAIVWPVAMAAAELLIAPERPPLRECAGEQCTWLFLDTTRNHSRRWCNMKGCGNQAKIRRYRRRHAP